MKSRNLSVLLLLPVVQGLLLVAQFPLMAQESVSPPTVYVQTQVQASPNLFFAPTAEETTQEDPFLEDYLSYATPDSIAKNPGCRQVAHDEATTACQGARLRVTFAAEPPAPLSTFFGLWRGEEEQVENYLVEEAPLTGFETAEVVLSGVVDTSDASEQDTANQQFSACVQCPVTAFQRVLTNATCAVTGSESADVAACTAPCCSSETSQTASDSAACPAPCCRPAQRLAVVRSGRPANSAFGFAWTPAHPAHAHHAVHPPHAEQHELQMAYAKLEWMEKMMELRAEVHRLEAELAWAHEKAEVSRHVAELEAENHRLHSEMEMQKRQFAQHMGMQHHLRQAEAQRTRATGTGHAAPPRPAPQTVRVFPHPVNLNEVQSQLEQLRRENAELRQQLEELSRSAEVQVPDTGYHR